MTVQADISINGNKKDVWSTITDIRSADKIINGIEKTEVLNEPAKGLVGLKWLETRMYFGKPATVEKIITEAVENEFYKTKTEVDGFLFLTTMAVAENGEGTRLTSSHETRPQGFFAKIKSLPMIFFRGMLRKAILKDLADIKSAVETK